MLAPAVGLCAVYALARGIAPLECTAAGRPEWFAGMDQAVEVLLIVGVAALFAVLFAATRFFAAGRRRVPRLAGTLLALGLVALAGTVYADLFAAANPTPLLLGVAGLGAAAAVSSLVELGRSWADDRSVEDAGAVLPFYLLATGLVLSPAVALLAFVGRGGATC